MAPTTQKKHLLHDYSLAKFLTYSFILVLAIGLTFNSGITFLLHQRERFFTAKYTSPETYQQSHYFDWKHVTYYQSGIELFKRKIPNSLLYRYKAETTVAVPMNVLTGIFFDIRGETEWVKDLVEIEELPLLSPAVGDKKEEGEEKTSLIRQRFAMPIPNMKDREYLLKQTIMATTKNSIAVEYISIEDDTNHPVCDGCVRGTNLGSSFTFTSLDDGQTTKIEAEIAIDPHIKAFSPFFVNNFQKKWLPSTLHGLVQMGRNKIGKEYEYQMPNIFHMLSTPMVL